MTKECKHADALKYNQAAIDKADRYVAWLKSRKLPTYKFNRLADQAVARNDFRVLEMVYSWAEFECRRYGN
jgi:hypothetical protein